MLRAFFPSPIYVPKNAYINETVLAIDNHVETQVHNNTYKHILCIVIY